MKCKCPFLKGKTDTLIGSKGTSPIVVASAIDIGAAPLFSLALQWVAVALKRAGYGLNPYFLNQT
jgi:hypothetical protein